MIRIYADFQHEDEDGRIPLICNGSLEDLESAKDQLFSGIKVVLYHDDEFEVEAILVREDLWFAEPEMDTTRYLDVEDT